MKRAACVLMAALFGLTACSSDNTNTITVSAAASLTDSFTALGAAFEQDNSGIVVRFNFAGSSTLAEQLVAGAPVDVFAAASSEAMDRAVQAGTVEQPELFATNTLAIAVPPNNPAQISRHIPTSPSSCATFRFPAAPPRSVCSMRPHCLWRLPAWNGMSAPC